MLTCTPPNPWSRSVSGVRWGTDPLTEYMKHPGVSMTLFSVRPVPENGDGDEVMTRVPRRAADRWVDWRIRLNESGGMNV